MLRGDSESPSGEVERVEIIWERSGHRNTGQFSLLSEPLSNGNDILSDLWMPQGLREIQRGRCLANFLAHRKECEAHLSQLQITESKSDHVNKRRSWVGMALTAKHHPKGGFSGWLQGSLGWCSRCSREEAKAVPSLQPSALLAFSWLLLTTGSHHVAAKMATQSLELTASQLTSGTSSRTSPSWCLYISHSKNPDWPCRAHLSISEIITVAVGVQCSDWHEAD